MPAGRSRDRIVPIASASLRPRGSAWSLPGRGSGGCGYSVRAPFDKSVKTVYVPVFSSVVPPRREPQALPSWSRRRSSSGRPYKVVGTPEEADTILDGTINFADKNIVVENPFNLPRELIATIAVEVKWTHNPPTEDEKNRAAHRRRPRPQLRPRSRRDVAHGLLPVEPEAGDPDRRHDGAAVVHRCGPEVSRPSTETDDEARHEALGGPRPKSIVADGRPRPGSWGS